LRTYLLLAAAEFRRYSTYRLAILAGVFTQSVFGFIRISVLIAAIDAGGGTLAGYDRRSASTYVWLGQALLAPIGLQFFLINGPEFTAAFGYGGGYAGQLPGSVFGYASALLVVDNGRLAFDGTLSGLAARVALQRVLVVDLPEPRPDLHVAEATHIGSELAGQRQRFAFSPQQTTAARVLAEVSAKTEVIDLTLEEPAIEDIVRTLYGAT
jgi:hypothetical protein